MKAQIPLCICAAHTLAVVAFSAEDAPKQAAQNSVAANAGLNRFSLEVTLPGHASIQDASTRPAAKANYLIYAAALDQYATAKEALLKDEPVLRRFIERSRRFYIRLARNYDAVYSSFSPSRMSKEEADSIDRFLSTGYDGKSRYEGELRKDLEAYAAELRRPDNQLTERPKQLPDAVAPQLPGPDLADLKDGLLPGQSGIEDRNKRAKLDLVLFAVSLDQHAIAKAELLKTLPVLQTIVNQELRNLQREIGSGPNLPGSAENQDEKVVLLRDLMAKGYSGQFRPAAEALIGSASGSAK